MSQNQPWEIGSEFHWTGLPEGPFIPWPQPRVEKYRGTLL